MPMRMVAWGSSSAGLDQEDHLVDLVEDLPGLVPEQETLLGNKHILFVPDEQTAAQLLLQALELQAQGRL